MKIERLTIGGVLRFQDPIALDFRDVPAGLIAVVGENGAGKTTILESMFAGFYGSMPSRADKPLFDLVSGRRDAFLEVEASFGSRGTYRARTNLDGLKRVRGATLTRLEGSRAVLVNDGKATTFDDAVRRTLPAPEMILASAFAAQSRRGSFTTLDRKGRKDLFVKLLNLDQLGAYADTCRKAASAVDRRRAELAAQVEVLRPMTTDSEADALGDEGNRLQVRLGELQRRERDIREELAGIERQVAVAREADEAGRAAREMEAGRVQRLAALQHELDVAIPAERRVLEERATRDGQASAGRFTAAKSRLDSALAALPGAIALATEREQAAKAVRARADARADDLRERRVNNASLIDRRAFIEAEIRALDELERAIAEQATVVEAARVRVSHAMEAHRLAERARAQAAHYPSDLARAESSAGLLETVPFGDQCADAGCAFVAQAVEARRQLPALRDGVAHLRDLEAAESAARDEYDRSKSDETAARRAHEALTARLTEFATARVNADRLKSAESRVAELDADLASVAEQLRVDLAAVDQQVEARATRLQQDRDRLNADLERATSDRMSEQEAIDRELELALQRLRARTDTVVEAIDALVRDRAATAAALRAAETAAVNLASAETAYGRAAAVLANVTADLARIDAEIVAFEHRRQGFAERQAVREALEADVESLSTELIEWQALARVFGGDGLPVLEIDAAGPGVSALANDLLQSCFGGRFTVEFVTQEAKASGTGLKETFELKVWDAERGGDARDLSDLSGGEQVIVDEAIKSAIALFVNSRNHFPIRTCWRDETGGALDAENAPRYLAMLRRIRERGGFHHMFVITHSAEIAAMADVQLVVANGSASIVYPPFTEVAS